MQCREGRPALRSPLKPPTDQGEGWQNDPNPSNPVTTIEYAIRRSGHISLAVYDLFGRQVAVLVDGVEEAGYRSVTFDASSLASGVYLYHLRAGEFTQTRKLAVVR